MTQSSVVKEKGRGPVNAVLAALSPRVAGLLSAALLALAFVLPIWQIELYAPQYPEGLTMTIWINRMAGDIGQVNLLNHYVGMKAIEPLSIPELVWMPKILLGLIVSAVIAALPNRRWLLAIWYLMFLALGTAGLWDFYRWEYDYGHNLDPHAPIQMPGADYQPPLFGSKTLLNITAISLPGWGGIAIFAASAISLLPLIYPFFIRKSILKKVPAVASAMLIALAAGTMTTACTQKGPEEIHIGQDTCGHCRMTISDPKFGGEVRLQKGKVLKFDALDCLISYAKENSSNIRETYVQDFFKPGHLIDAKSAYFTLAPGIRGPMGSNWIATSDTAQLENLIKGSQAKVVRWTDVISSS